jgi:hypothetical protein
MEDEISQSLRTPRAAAVSGVVFAILLAVAMVLTRLATLSDSNDASAWLANANVTLALKLVPFSGIAFLWFIGVLRDRIGQREDRFLATVFLGSGLLFLAMLFISVGIVLGVLADADATRPRAPSEAQVLSWSLSRGIAAAILHTYAMRMAAVFTMSTANIGYRTRFIPRGLAISGYLVAGILLVGIDFTRWVELLFPAWILVLSVNTLIEGLKRSHHAVTIE